MLDEVTDEGMGEDFFIKVVNLFRVELVYVNVCIYVI